MFAAVKGSPLYRLFTHSALQGHPAHPNYHLPTLYRRLTQKTAGIRIYPDTRDDILERDTLLFKRRARSENTQGNMQFRPSRKIQ